jgi:uncharacterized lipoprotein NlpE involved in copper resistance
MAKYLYCIILLVFMVMGCDNSSDKKDGVNFVDVEVLEKWHFGENGENIALLVKDTANFSESVAKLAAAERCEGECNVVYFYRTKEAYNLHAYKRTKFSNSDAFGSPKKLAKAQKVWENTNGNWEKVQNGLLATISFGEFSPYPYK